MIIPRPEHPNPQFERANWENLNGKWEFEIDKSNSGKARKLYEKERLDSEITVPFCPESKLSGIGDTDFLVSVWYKREINVKHTDELVILHIDACDYCTTLYINGKEVGIHKGGYTPAVFDITEYVIVGENTVVINAYDDTRIGVQPMGKQSDKYESYGCVYTRTTGIWQTVWLEYVPKSHIESFKVYPDSKNGKVTIRSLVTGNADLTITAYYEGREMAKETVSNCGNNADVTLNLADTHLWEIGNGRLYDLVLTYGDDTVNSYFGLRNVALDGMKFMLNEKCIFQRTVLDQGYYPDGIYTAPTEEAMIKDIEISLAAGFNGARLHHKVFEPRFIYHCDRMGYIVWGEYPHTSCALDDYATIPTILRECEEMIERDFNHPSIIGWIPYNESWFGQKEDVIDSVYRAVKLIDNTRPCIDISGFYHVRTDIFDIHDYTQDVELFTENLDRFEKDGYIPEKEWAMKNQTYRGEPVYISEYGGIKWVVGEDDSSWGYGNAPKTEEEFIERYKGLTEAILKNGKIMGFCYTQLYDIEQEKNGLYTYEREPKFDMSIFREINTQPAAIEETYAQRK